MNTKSGSWFAADVGAVRPGWRPASSELADPFWRFIAWFVNLLICLPAIFLLSWLTSRLLPPEIGIWAAVASYFLLFHIVPMALWGLTLGGWVAGVHVVQSDLAAPGFPRALIRLAVFTISFPVAVTALAVFSLPAILEIPNTVPRHLWWDAAAGTWAVRRTLRKPAKDAGSITAFKHALRFSDGDLRLNRVGRISWSQRLRLVLRELWLALLGAGILGLVALATSLLVVIGSAIDIREVVAALVAVGLGIYLLWRSYLHAADFIHGVAVTREATITRRVERGDEDSSTATYYLLIPSDGPEFRVSAGTYAALVPGRSYRFYTTLRGRRLLSMEPAVAETIAIQPQRADPDGPIR